ncbi:MAG TPA: DinB family protein [Vicinamibacterales bacterium]|nr:DinB family protein [Vicinamibacterales bacterium]
MDFHLSEGTAVLRRTPVVLRALLTDLPHGWDRLTEGPGTWSPYDVIGHLVHGERTDWIPRVEHILRYGNTTPFPPFDREAMFAASAGESTADLLATFEDLRASSLHRLHALALTAADLTRRGLHPALGEVTLGQHLATWVAHDLSHLSQIVRVLAAQYVDAVGPWRSYLSVLNPPAR